MADGTLPDAEFGNGTMVLPVAYTKGLEFDAVLLFNPGRENYPVEDKYVKLLYVAATRALHQLVIMCDDNLTGLISDPIPEGKHLKELSAPTLTKAFEYEKQNLTEKELNDQRVIEGIKDMRERNHIGPKPITLDKKETKSKSNLIEAEVDMNSFLNKSKNPGSTTAKRNDTRYRTNYKTGTKIPPKSKACNLDAKEKQEERKNDSPFEFMAMPDAGKLRPKGHSKADCSIRWINKKKDCVEMTSQAGMLRVMPIAADIIRVTFHKGQLGGIQPAYFDRRPKEGLQFKVRESKDAVEITTSLLKVVIERENGAVQFLSSDGKVLLAENKSQPRQVEDNQNWTYFEWEKSEKLKACGILKTDLRDLTSKAKYISHGGKNLRMPFLLSTKGYGIAIAAESTVLACNIPTYGNYIYCDKSRQSDYYFILGGDNFNPL